MLKVINSSMTVVGKTSKVIYHDADSFDEVDPSKTTQAYGVCFYEGRMVIGYGGKKDNWGLIGGTIEKNETFEQTLKREITEESNMEVLKFRPIGYQEVIKEDNYKIQLRYVCIVRPLGPFIKDPAGGVTEIKLINPKDYKKYFDWGVVGERIMERALELKSKL
jgi:ADP-ribose pyrophosphatase YjhB (NUDIX family)